MPAYLFTCDKCGVTSERIMLMSERADSVDCHKCGRKALRDIPAEHRGVGQLRCGTWPLKSDAAGVHPAQAKDAYEKSVRDGVPTDFTKDGQAVFTSARHRARYCRSIGLIDRNAGYSDAAPGQRRTG